MSGIGSFYDANNVIIGQAAGLIANANTALPGDTLTVFDESVWLSTTVQLGAPSAGTWTMTLAGQPLASPVTISGITFNVTNTALAALINAALVAVGSNLVATVTGAGTVVSPFKVSLAGTSAGRVLITGNGVGLTGGTFLVTPSPWVAAGATEQGWQVNYNPSVQDIYIEEQQTQVDQEVTTAVLEFVASLAEDIMQNLQYALNAAQTLQAADVTHFAKTTLTLSQGSLTRYAVCVETKGSYGFPRRYYAPQMTCAANFSQSFRRANGLRMVPVTFRSVCPVDQIVVAEITANHS